MSNLAIKQATYQDIIDISENIVGEIINGQLETHPRPAPKHALAAGSIAPFAEHTFSLSDLWE
jgi:hypothetical protein